MATKVEKRSTTKEVLIRAVPFVSTLIVGKLLDSKRGKKVANALDRRADRVKTHFVSSIAGTQTRRRRGLIVGGVTALALGAGILARGLKG